MLFERISRLRRELEIVAEFQPAESEMIPYLRSFSSTMFELVECAQLLEKPIEF
jgi:hypothetical protein